MSRKTDTLSPQRLRDNPTKTLFLRTCHGPYVNRELFTFGNDKYGLSPTVN